MSILRAVLLLTLGLLVANCSCHCWAQEIFTAADAGPGASVSSTGTVLPNNAGEAPANPPKVTCNGNQLTIAADNSSMGSVLAAVRTCIGVQIEVPEGCASERTFTKLGPGPAREVLESLLSSTDYDFVIELSQADPGKIHSVMLLARAKDTKDGRNALDAGERPLTPVRRAWLDMQRKARPADPGSDETQPARAEAAEAIVAPVDSANATLADAGQIPAKTPIAGDAPASTDTTAAALVKSNVGTSSGASKEMPDKISSMEQLFEQRKQMIQNQGSGPKP